MLKPKQIARIKVLRYAQTASASRSSPTASGGRVSRLVQIQGACRRVRALCFSYSLKGSYSRVLSEQEMCAPQPGPLTSAGLPTSTLLFWWLRDWTKLTRFTRGARPALASFISQGSVLVQTRWKRPWNSNPNFGFSWLVSRLALQETWSSPDSRHLPWSFHLVPGFKSMRNIPWNVFRGLEHPGIARSFAFWIGVMLLSAWLSASVSASVT